ncbi:MarC family protein [Flavobacteriales bacterium]|jgi:multiple antibiotic resistance protein|nr:MarC family protein [Flavobacteriales bacterium]|tara:strand:- start:694 stop:1257 length:564 start_codon:yes stop_codon:yes gene_type:complete
MNFNDILTITLTLFAVIDILGSIPIIIGFKAKMGHIQSEKATLVAGVLMILFLFVGEQILNLIGIDIASFALAGAFVIFLLALEMILDIELFKTDPNDSSGSIVPIAFPLIAGAGTLTTIISLRSTYSINNIIVGIIINLIFVYLVLKSTGKIERILGKAGINVVRRVFGIILLAIAIKLTKIHAFI